MHARSASKTTLLLGYVIVTVGACDSILDVDNPNNVTDDDIRNNTGAAVWTNGALFAVQRGWDWALGAYSAVSDELRGIDPWQEMVPLDLGHVGDPANPSVGDFYLRLAQGRWMADEAIVVLDSLAAEGVLTDSTLLARTYFYGAIAYTAIADWMDDFTFSDRTAAGPAVGPENMRSLYDTALTYLTNALALEDSVEFRRDALAYRAKVKHAMALWDQIGLVPITINGNSGLVSNQSAVDDAESALNEDSSDWRYKFNFQIPNNGSETVWRFQYGIKSFRFGDRYVTGARGSASVVLLDPIDAVPDPWLEGFALGEVFVAVGATGYVDLTVVSAREMHLIIAEDALAQADTTTFASEINAIRSIDGLTIWTTASPVTALDMLIYQRQVNLFLQGKRLHDMYRFGIVSDFWETHSAAYTTPGTFFPISQREIEANCHLNPSVECQ